MKKDRFSIDMRKIFCFLFLLIIANLAAIAQQDPEFSFNKLTHLTVNPGFAGSNYGVNGLLLNRYQWSGFDGAPKTLLFSVGAQTKLFNIKSGVGLNIMSDEIGYFKNTTINFDYAYRITTSIGELGIGASFGVFNESIDGEWEAPDNTSGVEWDTSDPLLPQGEVTQLALDFGLGAFLKSKRYFLGLSVTHINEAEITYEEEVFYYLSRHYYLLGGYNINLSNSLFVLQPSVLIKTDLASKQIDFNAEVIYNNRISGALNYRLDDSFGLQLKYELFNGLKAGIAFELVTSEIGRYGYSSQELFVSYSFNLEKKRSNKYKSVRFL